MTTRLLVLYDPQSTTLPRQRPPTLQVTHYQCINVTDNGFSDVLFHGQHGVNGVTVGATVRWAGCAPFLETTSVFAAKWMDSFIHSRLEVLIEYPYDPPTHLTNSPCINQ